MIRNLHLRNFKCFQNLDIPLERFSLLAELNGSGKSSIIQSLLLLHQSWRSGDLASGRLALNGAMTDLGTGADILFEGADEDLISIGLDNDVDSRTTKPTTVLWPFAYDREGDRLTMIADDEMRKALSAAIYRLSSPKNSLAQRDLGGGRA